MAGSSDPLAAAFEPERLARAQGEVDLTSANFADEDTWGRFVALLSTSSGVRRLCLAHCHLTSAHCGELGDALAGSADLVELDMSFNDITTGLGFHSDDHSNHAVGGFESLCRSLVAHCPALRSLYLSHNLGLEERGAAALSAVLPSMRSLRVLQLDGNKVGDMGVQALAAGIDQQRAQQPQPGFPGLCSLGIVAVGLTDAGAEALCVLLQGGSGTSANHGAGEKPPLALTHLDLTGNRLSSEMAARLRGAVAAGAATAVLPLDLQL